MNILVLFASPNTNGSTRILTDYFTKGAKEAGHVVKSIDLNRTGINPCLGCIACEYHGPCVQDDDMDEIRYAILNADMLVFATPLYYFGMTSVLKTVIDRFIAFNQDLQDKHLKSALLSVAADHAPDTFDALSAHYKKIADYLNFNDQGMVLGLGCAAPPMTMKSPYPQAAYELGKKL